MLICSKKYLTEEQKNEVLSTSLVELVSILQEIETLFGEQEEVFAGLAFNAKGRARGFPSPVPNAKQNCLQAFCDFFHKRRLFLVNANNACDWK